MTAVLEAEVSKFEAGMKAADSRLSATRREIDKVRMAIVAFRTDLNSLELPEREVAQIKAGLNSVEKSVLNLDTTILKTKDTLRDLSLPASAVAKNAATTAAEVKQINEVRDAAIEANAAMADMGVGVIGRVRQLGPRWGNRIFEGPPVGGYRGAPVAPGSELMTLAEARLFQDLTNQNQIYSRTLQKIFQGYETGPMGPLTREQYLAQYATPAEGRPLKIIREEIIDNPLYNFATATDAEINRRDAAAAAYLKSKGIDVGNVGGVDVFKRNQEHDALIAAALGLQASGPLRRGLGFLGWGRGGGIHIPGFGVAGGGRGGFGLFGRNIFGGMAGFGTPLGLAGFGAERALFSSLGILGSFGGGILGGGILGAGALGTMMVGAGTNMAGMGQAAGDIHTVSTDLGALKTAIQQYGKNSTQAAQAQLQLNTDLKGFSPVARNAVLAAAQTSQAFKAMFDKLTGPAEKIGATIINQAMQVGMKFLPTIAKFARQNMSILQSGLQPFFSWLTKGGNAQGVITDVNRLTQAQQQFGKHSVQAAQANQNLIQTQKGVGGLGFFTDLEKVFQKNFPTAIHTGEQGFELLVKTIDLAAQHLGHFMAALNSFFTRMNNQDFGSFASMIEKLIGLFHSWLGMFVAFGRLIFDIFKPAVGLGKAFAELMTRIFNQVAGYINQKGTQNILGKLFTVHLKQLIGDIGGLLMQMLPIVENIASAFIQIEAAAAQAAGVVIGLIRDIFAGWNAVNKALGGIPSKLAAGLIAFRIIQKANVAIFGGVLKLLRAIPFIGILFGSAATEAETAVGAVTASIDAAAASIVGAVGRAALAVRELAASFGLVGDAAVVSATEADAAMNTMGGVATAETVAVSRGSGLFAAGKGMLLRAGIYGTLGYFGGQFIGKEVGGKKGSHYGSYIGAGAGLGFAVGDVPGAIVGAGIGAFVAAITSQGPSTIKTLQRMSDAVKEFGKQAKLAAASGNSVAAMQARLTRNKQINTMASTISKDLKEAGAAQREYNKTLHDSSPAIQNEIAGQKQYKTAMDKSAQAQIDFATGADHSTQAINKQIAPLQKVYSAADIASQKLRQMAASVASSDPQLSLVLSRVAQLNQQLGHMPTHKRITILIHEVFSASFKKGLNDAVTAMANAARAFMGLPPLPRGGDHHGATIHLGLPQRIQDAITAAADGHGSIVKANKAAYEYYQRQLRQPGLTHAQRMKLYAAQTQYYNAIYGVPGGLPRGIPKPGNVTAAGHVPFGYLDKQQAETARARIDINKGQFAAALKLLNLEKQQLEAMLKTAKNQAERTRILSQLATVTGLIGSTKQSLTGLGPNSYAIPLALQLAMAKADALAALNPNLTGPTSQQYKLAVEAKKAAMRVINGHSHTMQQLIDAWNVVGQMNQIISQRMANKLAMYHKVSTDTITDMIKGLTQAQEMQLREALAQKQAHRGYAPNQGYQSSPGSTPASHHHRRHHHGGGGGGGGNRTLAASHSGGTTIHIDTIEIHGVQNVRQLAAEIERLARQKHQRAGGRR